MIKSIPKGIKPGDLVLVHWDDAWSPNHGWRDRQEMLDSGSCDAWSVGRFMGLSKCQDVMLSGSWDEGNMVNNTMGRPVRMIRKITKLKGNNTWLHEKK